MPRPGPPSVVFVPGVPASTLVDTEAERTIFFRPREADSSRWKREFVPRLRGPEDLDEADGVVAGEAIGSIFKAVEPILDVGIGKQAASLFDLLRRNGVDRDRIRSAGWDWRRPLDDPATLESVARAVEAAAEAADESERVTVIAHGAGGLVVRSAFDEHPELAEIVSDLVFFGVPWAGCPEALRLLVSPPHYPPFDKKQLKDILSHSWGIYELLPLGPDRVEDDEGPLEQVVDAEGSPTSPLDDVSWIGKAKATAYMRDRVARAKERADGRRKRFGTGDSSLRIWNLVGWGLPTSVRAVLDGNEVELDDPAPEGDGVVPRRSATWIEADDVRHIVLPMGGFTPVGHAHLWRNRAAREVLANVLEDPTYPFELVFAAVDADDSGADPAKVRVRLVAQDEHGRKLPEAEVQLLDGGEPVPFRDDGRLTIYIQRHRWRQARSDVRQKRVAVTWDEDGRTRRKDMNLLTGGRES